MIHRTTREREGPFLFATTTFTCSQKFRHFPWLCVWYVRFIYLIAVHSTTTLLPDGIYSCVGISIWLKVNCILLVNASMQSISRRHEVFLNSPQLVLQNQQRTQWVRYPKKSICNYFIMLIFLGILNFDFYFCSLFPLSLSIIMEIVKEKQFWKLAVFRQLVFSTRES